MKTRVSRGCCTLTTACTRTRANLCAPVPLRYLGGVRERKPTDSIIELEKHVTKNPQGSPPSLNIPFFPFWRCVPISF